MPLHDPAAAQRTRTDGLDTLRALAIVLVFVYHYRVFVSGTPDLGWLAVIGWTGVDLFFVLSGYLIANQLLGGLVRGRSLSLPSFYARRALRTLPVFWVVLAAYFCWPAAMGGRTPPPLWTFLTFTQNIGLQAGTAFSHAWSLCIEEQFYLVLPLLLVAGQRWRLGARAGWALMGALLLGVAARCWLWTRFGREADGQLDRYYAWVYYGTLCRFDEFLPGVALALLKNAHPDAWARLMKHGQALLLAGLVATGLMFWGLHQRYYIDGYGYGFAMSAFGYSLMAMAFGLLVAAALSPHSGLHRLRVPGAYSLALWSYAIYLSHKAVGVILKAQLAPLAPPPWLQFGLIALASIALGALLQRLVEAPFMALRDRRWPSLFTPAQTATASRSLPPSAARSADAAR